MRLATTHFHDPNGSGCPCCSEKYAAMRVLPASLHELT